MGQVRPEAIYEDVEDWRSAEARRGDPHEVTFTKAGARRRTSFMSKSLVEGGPRWKDGGRTGWYVAVDVNRGKTTLVSVQTAAELASLPSNALPAQEYCNLIAKENGNLSAALLEFLAEDADAHTAYHTNGSDLGKRAKLIFAREQLDQIPYQDKRIGEGIKIPDVVHRPRDPASLVRPDGIKW